MQFRNEKEKVMFFKKIDIYNENKDYCDHYLNLGNGVLMIIRWDGGIWDCHIESLEEGA